MKFRDTRLARLLALTVVVSMPLLGMAGVASAKTPKAHPKCLKHPNRAICLNSGGGGSSGGTGGGTGGGGTGGPTVQIAVTVSPNPLVETGQSEIHAVIQVGTLPSFSGDTVNIDSSQLSASCFGGLTFESIGQPLGLNPLLPRTSPNRIDVVIDNDGNATVIVDGYDCAPGTSVIEADLEVAPFLTALTTLVASPPAVTPEGVSGYPQAAGIAQEVETGDTSTSGDSDIYAVFYVETNPVYAEQTVEIGSSQLEGRCIRGWRWEAGNTSGVGVGGGPHSPVTGVGVNTNAKVSTILDDDGNAVFVFKGVSCAAGPSQVIADVLAGTHLTYVGTFTVLPPAPTI
jgi:hypothetical protein